VFCSCSSLHALSFLQMFRPGFGSYVLALMLMLPAVAGGQDWKMPWSDERDRLPRVDLSVTAGFLAPTDWSDVVLLGSLSSASGVLEQMLGT
jgi:hypothetical protein